MKMQAINWELTKISPCSWSRGNSSKSVLFHIPQSSNHWHSAKERKSHMNFVITIMGKPPGNGPHRTKFAPGCIWTWIIAEAGILSYHTAYWKDWGLKYDIFGTQTICLYSKASRTSIAWCWEPKILQMVNEKIKALETTIAHELLLFIIILGGLRHGSQTSFTLLDAVQSI